MEGDWRLRKSSLEESLGHIFSTGFYSDVAFLVGEEEFRINAHKTILSARSEVLATMFHERWTSVTEQEIKMPLNKPAAVKQFLKFVYTDFISFENVGLDDILEITHLAHMYQVHKLLEQCIAHLTATICEKNCFQIHKSCEHLDERLSDKALQFFLENVVPRAKWNGAYLSWDYEILEKILKDDREHVPEPILFRALLKWRNVDSGRNEEFQKLSRLIRFPTMKPMDFASSEVIASGVLSNEEIDEVFSYIATKSGSVKFPTKRRKSIVSTSTTGNNRTDVKICRSPTVPFSAQSFLQMLKEPGGNFSKFTLKMHGEFPQIYLYGVKFFNSTVNNAYLAAYLQSRDFRINVTADEDRGFIGSTARTIEKTIPELNQLQMRAYFDSPFVISRNRSYSITTNLTPAPGTEEYYRHDDARFGLPQLL